MSVEHIKVMTVDLPKNMSIIARQAWCPLFLIVIPYNQMSCVLVSLTHDQ